MSLLSDLFWAAKQHDNLNKIINALKVKQLRLGVIESL